MFHHALLTTRKFFGCAAIVAVLVFLTLLVTGRRGYLAAIVLGVAFACVFAWWWCRHCLEVRGIAEQFRDPGSGPERDTEW